MNTSPRKIFACGMVLFILVGIAIGIAAAEIKIYSLKWIFLAWIVIGSFCLLKIRCPKCKTPVAYQGRLGKMSIYAGFVRKTCLNCGHDLTK
jgi:hypothetical protein